MKVENNINSINFGQKVPTKSLLRIGSGFYNFEEAKDFCQIFDKRFPGHVGYYKKARNYTKQIENKNPELKEIISDISTIANNNEKLREISKQVNRLGEEIDVLI